MSRRRIAVIGTTESGKTSAVIALCRGLWRAAGTRTIAFDPWLAEDPARWGNAARAWANFDVWRNVVFSVTGCAVVLDEGTSTGGRDRDNVELFTAIRHRHPVLIFVGHDAAAMLPVMRATLTDLILFRCSPDEAAKWAEIFTDRDLLAAPGLAQYEFLHKRAFQRVTRRKLTPAELDAGFTL